MKNSTATISACSANVINETIFTSRVMPKVMKTVSFSTRMYPHFSAQDKEDLVQDILVKLWEARSSYNPELGSVEAWAGKSAYYHVLDQQDKWMRKGRFEKSLSDFSFVHEDDEDDEERVFSSFVMEQNDCQAELDRDIVHSVFDMLSHSDRKVLEMVMHNLNGEQMAEELGCSVNAVYVRIHKAKKRFADIYEQVLNDGSARIVRTKPFERSEITLGFDSDMAA